MIAVNRLCMRQRAAAATAWVLVAGGVALALGSCSSGRHPCSKQSDCNGTQACQAGACVTPCFADTDCSGAVDTCQNGICAPTANPTCTADSDCTQPGTCQQAQGAQCRGGKCQYLFQAVHSPCQTPNACAASEECDGAGKCVVTSISCDQPPSNSCSADDSTYRSYHSAGQCDPRTGDCNYTYTDIACSNCTAYCLPLCNGVSCAVPAGGCQASSACAPTDPPSCIYTLAAEGTRCDLAGSAAGSKDGVCTNVGNCVGCRTAADCTMPPIGPMACSTAACTSGDCVYAPTLAAVCGAQTCTNGLRTNVRTCSSDGSCPDMGTLDCQGRKCNSAGSDCLPSCTGDSDCLTGYFCRSDGSCAPNCAAGRTRCGDSCVDTMNDSAHCNGCTNVCTTGLVCAGGTCTANCGTGLTNCSNNCVAVSTDAGNCSTCGHVCTAPAGNGIAACTGGACDVQCDPGYSKCNGQCITFDTTANCGSCGNNCGTAACCGGQCLAAFDTVANCGSCGHRCPGRSNATPVCNSGTCGIQCNNELVDCGITCKIDCTTCFVAGTPIALANGSTTPIEGVTVGDEVLSYDPDRGDFVSGRVTRLLVHPRTPKLLRINGVLTTTAEHRFYVGGEWVPAGELHIGDLLLGDGSAGIASTLGADQRVVSLEELPGGVTTYNFEVEQYHDYFAGGVLVHNAK